MNLSRSGRATVLTDALDTARGDISNAAGALQNTATLGMVAFALISLVAIVALVRTLGD